MKTFILAAAALIAGAGAMPAALSSSADAQRTVVRETTVVRTSAYRGGYHHGWRGNRWNHGGRTVCRSEWRHHHRERVCRRIHY